MGLPCRTGEDIAWRSPPNCKSAISLLLLLLLASSVYQCHGLGCWSVSCRHKTHEQCMEKAKWMECPAGETFCATFIFSSMTARFYDEDYVHKLHITKGCAGALRFPPSCPSDVRTCASGRFSACTQCCSGDGCNDGDSRFPADETESSGTDTATERNAIQPKHDLPDTQLEISGPGRTATQQERNSTASAPNITSVIPAEDDRPPCLRLNICHETRRLLHSPLAKAPNHHSGCGPLQTISGLLVAMLITCVVLCS